ncbi:MAG: 50S ribosomal protein L4 [Candidatus Babeliales bacterium]|nr:MAG: 50S ribosomal protein L4 [candidate division TM6 bacterium GW2011_GWF2_36_6]
MSEIIVYGLDGNVQGSVNFDITEKATNSVAFARAIRVLRQNWRQGTVGCKTRAELAFSNRKPWKQKGTGRARAGSLRSPLWRKGGVIFGPQPRTRTLSMNGKEMNLVFNNILFSKLAEKAIACLDFNVSAEKPVTKLAQKMLKAADLDNKKVLLFLPFDDITSIASFRNIPNVHIVSFDQPNAFDLINGGCWVFFKKDVDLFKEMISRWN